jgi:hypothetical protein
MNNEKKDLPPRKTHGHPHELAAGLSDTVIVTVKGVQGFAMGRYMHELKEWQVDNFQGWHEVIEWWPLPRIGTGYKTNI